MLRHRYLSKPRVGQKGPHFNERVKKASLWDRCLHRDGRFANTCVNHDQNKMADLAVALKFSIFNFKLLLKTRQQTSLEVQTRPFLVLDYGYPVERQTAVEESMFSSVFSVQKRRAVLQPYALRLGYSPLIPSSSAVPHFSVGLGDYIGSFSPQTQWEVFKKCSIIGMLNESYHSHLCYTSTESAAETATSLAMWFTVSLIQPWAIMTSACFERQSREEDPI